MRGKFITLEGGEGDSRIVSAMIELARTFNLRTVAEGVENERVAEELVGLGCNVAQGFHYARPMGPQAMDEWLEREQRAQSGGAGALVGR